VKDQTIDDRVLLRALKASVQEAFAEMLPDVPIDEREDTDHGMSDAAIVTLSGSLCGSLAVQIPRDSTQALARRIAGDLAGEDDGQMADSGFLTQLEQDSLRELSNRVGCIFAGLLTDATRRLSPTFPIFVYGHDVNIHADCDYNVGLAFLVDNRMRVQARVFLAVPKPSADRAEQIRDIERLRAEFLSGETE
jgi:CheY-specific phosphatase CheX